MDGSIVEGLIAIGAGLAVMTGIGCGIGQGVAAAHASDAVGKNPEAEGKIRIMMIIGQAITESSALYGLLISLILIFTKMG